MLLPTAIQEDDGDAVGADSPLQTAQCWEACSLLREKSGDRPRGGVSFLEGKSGLLSVVGVCVCVRSVLPVGGAALRLRGQEGSMVVSGVGWGAV